VKWGGDEYISSYYEELRWLKVHSRYVLRGINLTFSILHSKRPQILYDNFEFKRNKILRTTRTLYDTLISLCIALSAIKGSLDVRLLSSGMACPLTFAMLLVCMFLRAKCMIIYSNLISDWVFVAFCMLSYCYTTFYFYFFSFSYKHFFLFFVCITACLFNSVRFAFIYVLSSRLRGLYPSAH